MSKKISLAEFAELVGKSRSAITQAVKEGRLLVSTDAEGRQWLDRDQAVLQWGIEESEFDKDGNLPLTPCDVQDFEINGIGEDGVKIPDIYKSKAKQAFFRAKQEELAFEIKLKKYLLAEDVERDRFAEGRMLRSGFQNLSSKLAPLCAAETDVKKVERLIDDEIRSILSNLADGTPKPE